MGSSQKATVTGVQPKEYGVQPILLGQLTGNFEAAAV